MTKTIDPAYLVHADAHEDLDFLLLWVKFNKLFDKFREMRGSFSNYTNEKIVQFLSEYHIASVVGDKIGEEFKMFSSPYMKDIDVVSKFTVAQIKSMGGYGDNSLKFNMKSGVKVCDYAENISSSSDEHCGLFIVANYTTQEVAVVPSSSFHWDDTTYVSWSKVLKSKGVQVFELTSPMTQFTNKAVSIYGKEAILGALEAK